MSGLEFWRRGKSPVWHACTRDVRMTFDGPRFDLLSLCEQHNFPSDAPRYEPWTGDNFPTKMCKKCAQEMANPEAGVRQKGGE